MKLRKTNKITINMEQTLEKPKTSFQCTYERIAMGDKITKVLFILRLNELMSNLETGEKRLFVSLSLNSGLDFTTLK